MLEKKRFKVNDVENEIKNKNLKYDKRNYDGCDDCGDYYDFD